MKGIPNPNRIKNNNLQSKNGITTKSKIIIPLPNNSRGTYNPLLKNEKTYTF